MLVELRVGEQRYRAVWEVLEGASVTEVARRFGVSRQSVHTWLRRYAADQGLGDRSSRPYGCPHQMSPVVEARIVEIRWAHPAWGADRISKVWPLCVGAQWNGYARSRIAVGSAASHGVSIVSSKLFPSILT